MLFLISLLFLFTAVLGQHPVHEASRLQTRIIGGQFIPVGHVPYQAVIRASLDQCGAILIAPQWLLTAEHCLQDRDITKVPIDVFLGVSHLDEIDNYTPGRVVKRRAVRYFLGPRIEIGNRTERSDLMLLKLDRKVTTSGNIKPIELPEMGTRWMVNQTAIASGFGKMTDGANGPSRTLRFIRVPIISKRDCLAMYRKKLPEHYQELRRMTAPESVLCAGISGEGLNVCSGDSGGPLAVCATPLTSGQLMCEDNRWQLAGVISSIHTLTDKCAEPNTPALYANVPVFAEWIQRTMSNN